MGCSAKAKPDEYSDSISVQPGERIDLERAIARLPVGYRHVLIIAPLIIAFLARCLERFKKLEGKWRGRSTKGWEETLSFKTIAGGSVVVSTSFDAHPNETMMTMYHLDGERLEITHYCVAKNQPRLVATSFADDGKTITFTFLDGTNLPSRDRGHMDKVIFRFRDDSHITSQWTWYQNGKESWMEEIQLERVP